MEESELKGLIASAKQGDERAFAELTRRAMEQRSDSSLKSTSEPVAPVVGEALCAAVRNSEQSGQRPASPWLTWLHRLVEQVRQGRSSLRVEDTNPLNQGKSRDALSDSSSQLLHATDGEPDDSSEAALCAKLVRLTQRCLVALPDQDRIVLESRYWMGCTMPELARRLDCTEAEAAMRLRLANASFRREMLRENSPDDSDR